MREARLDSHPVQQGLLPLTLVRPIPQKFLKIPSSLSESGKRTGENDLKQSLPVGSAGCCGWHPVALTITSCPLPFFARSVGLGQRLPPRHRPGRSLSPTCVHTITIRLVCSKQNTSTVITALPLEVEYPKFKAVIHGHCLPARALMGVWREMYEFQGVVEGK